MYRSLQYQMYTQPYVRFIQMSLHLSISACPPRGLFLKSRAQPSGGTSSLTFRSFYHDPCIKILDNFQKCFSILVSSLPIAVGTPIHTETAYKDKWPFQFLNRFKVVCSREWALAFIFTVCIDEWWRVFSTFPFPSLPCSHWEVWPISKLRRISFQQNMSSLEKVRRIQNFEDMLKWNHCIG